MVAGDSKMSVLIPLSICELKKDATSLCAAAKRSLEGRVPRQKAGYINYLIPWLLRKTLEQGSVTLFSFFRPFHKKDIKKGVGSVLRVSYP